jgi:MOSC domain-containing protein YiiM
MSAHDQIDEEDHDGAFALLRIRHSRDGRVEWIGLRPRYRAELIEVSSASALASRGLEGDRAAITGGGKRQVTLIQHEHLAAVAALVGRNEVLPGLARRNIAVSRINLVSLIGCRFRIGQAVLEGTGHCHPCSRMEENLGRGGYNAMRGHGGITARVVQSGAIGLGDPVSLIREGVAR